MSEKKCKWCIKCNKNKSTVRKSIEKKWDLVILIILDLFKKENNKGEAKLATYWNKHCIFKHQFLTI